MTIPALLNSIKVSRNEGLAMHLSLAGHKTMALLLNGM